jgi:hypothetical protein
VHPEVHIALLHYPVLNKEGRIVATAVTNLDIHDNARSAKTFGVSTYYLVTPLDAQVELVSRILGHWRDGYGSRRVPNRREALDLATVTRSFDEVVTAIAESSGNKPVVISTCARRRPDTVTFASLRTRMTDDPGPYLLVFGTGYGLADEILEKSDAVLEPIGTPEGWNHLSVRSAVAIVLDRLLGRRHPQ